LFSVMAITTYHRLGVFKQHKFVLSQLWKTEVWIQVVVGAMFLLEALCIVFSLLKLLVVACICWLVVASVFTLFSSSLLLCVCLSKFLLFLSYKDICDCIQILCR
jgi:hypothetical protein